MASKYLKNHLYPKGWRTIFTNPFTPLPGFLNVPLLWSLISYYCNMMPKEGNTNTLLHQEQQFKVHGNDPRIRHQIRNLRSGNPDNLEVLHLHDNHKCLKSELGRIISLYIISYGQIQTISSDLVCLLLTTKKLFFTHECSLTEFERQACTWRRDQVRGVNLQ